MTTAQLEFLQRSFANALDGAEHEQPLHRRLKPVPSTAAWAPAPSRESRISDSHTHLADGLDLDASVHSRIGLYRGNVRTHWRAALANAYPVLLALVGDAWFDALSIAYARAHPSQSGDLNSFGDQLPAFIGKYERDRRYRYFGDVARLEWSLHVAYFAADVTPFTPQQWLEVGEDRLLDSQLIVNPACTALASRHAIIDIWMAHQPGSILPRRLHVSTWTLVVRPRWRPTILVHSAAAHAAFVALQGGKTLNEALDAALALDPEFDFTSQWQTWISATAITGAVTGTTAPSVSRSPEQE
ncbi:HvfC/BufC family peptide modification chaperone [Paraburkholderia sp. GAS32]|uniref:HvfC/BufC family peptide modification chaperone n=1 Tax=Paraburkholderia sp. GAS32 TaxID=3035129 RepID=UPI003D25B9B9